MEHLPPGALPRLGNPGSTFPSTAGAVELLNHWNSVVFFGKIKRVSVRFQILDRIPKIAAGVGGLRLV